MSARWRVGTVPFLNERPLTAALDGAPDLAWTRAEPGTLAEALRAGALDGALLPVAEVLRGGFVPLAPYGIACRGAVKSVCLWADGPREALREIRVPAGSRSSVALLRLLCGAWGARDVRFLATAFPPDLREPPPGASLLFGDVALRCGVASRRPVIDLGAAWLEWTGLPFVFARWVGRSGAPPGLGARLAAAAEEGLARLDAIAAAEAPARGLPLPVVTHYLTRAIVYRLGPDEEAGQAEFARRARP